MTFAIDVSDYKIARLERIHRVSCPWANCTAASAVTCNRHVFVAVDHAYKEYMLESIQYAYAITGPFLTSCCSSGIVLYRNSASALFRDKAMMYGMYTYSAYTDSYYDIMVVQYGSMVQFKPKFYIYEVAVKSENGWTTTVIMLTLPAVIA